ncbi:hypothetical protein R1sor_011448 [Riccia sorocarpa]|uniref:Glycosyltransferase n=1 Tax=Riccia sorocarpa TaxID=122646 RepID=A0ABD3I3M9_9MARC
MSMDSLSDGSVDGKPEPNVWLVPLLYISHVRSFLRFAKQLARLGVTVTFFCIKEDAERLGIDGSNNPIFESWKREGMDLRLREFGVKAPQRADGLGGECDDQTKRSHEQNRWIRAFDEQTEKFELILKWELERGQSKPTCIISDYWCPGVHAIAVKYNVPAWVFSTFPVGCATIPLSLIGKTIGPSLLQAEVVLFSTFQELEPKPVIEFKEDSEKCILKGKQRGYCLTTAPLPSSDVCLNIRKRNGTDEEKERDPCLTFLDTQAECSVLYGAFGCNWNLLPEQMQEVVLGLENSGQPFLVLFRPPIKSDKYPTDDIFDALPPGCVERTKGRGLFVQGWVPQVEILAHPAVGGFLSHCGLNSYLETVCMGVPIITWPFDCEQYMNASTVVAIISSSSFCRKDPLLGQIQIGIEVPKSYASADVVDRKDVETKVRALFHSEQGRIARHNVLEYRDLAIRSISQNGSTFNNMKTIVARIRDLAAGRTTK